ncbi:DUF5719 family protein [Pseudoclavibacter sp. CFCC 13611]|uniref:DUF5719 family protein n=1 Tax=Pseudoclavibacter sp. CFCC 13611 TaxID=2615178 RepID=UPI0013012646|nr:DUF5719 family protein [Pseudoclavibacter sp. CFCC 13611]KAB1663192.1 hypothetical protein F8O08_05320 [Pseudoclavibacter sp. CFCC 13611]
MMSDTASEQTTPKTSDAPAAQPEASSSGTQPGGVRRVARQASRWLLSVVVVVALVAGGWALTRFATPEVDLSRQASTVVPASVESTRVCPVGFRTGGSMTSVDAGEAVGSGSIAAISDSDLTVQSLGQSEATPFGAAGRVATRDGVSASTVVRTSTDHQSALGVLSGARVDDGQSRGTLLADCTSPTFDSWIGGGSQQVGRSTSVRVVNPSSLASTVTLTVFTGEGQLLSSTGELNVEAGSERVLPISAVTTTDQQIFVRVQAVRAPVAAFLQQSTVRGLEAGGLDVQAPGAQPATQQSITGVRISGGAERADLAGEGGWEDTQPVLRLLSPDEGTVAHVTVSGADSRSFDVSLTQGVVVDTPLGDLPDGDYQISTTADASIVAAARVTSGGRDQADFTWLQSSDAVTAPLSFAVPSTPTSLALKLSGAPSSTVSVQVDGASRDVQLDDSGLGSLDLSAGQSVEVRPTQAVHLSVVTSGGDGIAVAALAGAESAGAVDVLAR